MEFVNLCVEPQDKAATELFGGNLKEARHKAKSDIWLGIERLGVNDDSAANPTSSTPHQFHLIRPFLLEAANFMETLSRAIERTSHHTTSVILNSPRSPVRSVSKSCVALALTRHQNLPSLISQSTYLPTLSRSRQTLRIQLLCKDLTATRLYSHSYALSNIRTRNTHTMATSDPSVPLSVSAAPEVAQKQLSGVEASKRLAAYKAVEDHFDVNYKYIGIGSGSTVVYVVEAIAAKGRDVTSRMIFVPTYEILLKLSGFLASM